MRPVSSNNVAALTQRSKSPNPAPGPVARVVAEQNEDTISVTIANASGGALTYVIGDGNGVYADASGLTLTNPTGGDLAAAVMKADFASRPCSIKAITYIVTTSTAQFSNAFKRVTGFRNGDSKAHKINVAKERSSADQNTLVRTLTFDPNQEPILSGNEGITLVVNDGETVNLEMTVGSSRIR